jgi:two-component system chemotaxis response regulator CheB
MPRRPISVVVVDDSAFMRKALKRMLASDAALEVVGDAADGPHALEIIARLRPDVVTLDVNMPGMDGLTVLRRVMQETPTPVLMVSAVTQDGGAVTLQALELGAVDFVDKSACHTMMDIVEIAETLINKVKVVAGVDLRRIASLLPAQPALPPRREPAAEPGDAVPTHLVAIGSSTGGPIALETILQALPAGLPAAVVVAQHMPPGFTRALADRLNGQTRVHVTEAEEGELLRAGWVYIAPAGYHLVLRRGEDGVRAHLTRSPQDSPHHPSVDVLFGSVAEEWRGPLMGVVLTGMGADGSEGIKRLRARRAVVLAQDEASCVVFGMPRAAQLTGCVDRMVPLLGVAGEIVQFAQS